MIIFGAKGVCHYGTRAFGTVFVSQYFAPLKRSSSVLLKNIERFLVPASLFDSDVAPRQRWGGLDSLEVTLLEGETEHVFLA
jgi:hypothetical protein